MSHKMLKNTIPKTTISARNKIIKDTLTKSNHNSSAGSKTPILKKKREASTPTDEKKNSSTSSFGDISNISLLNSKVPIAEDESSYSKYLSSMILDTVLEKNIEEKSLDIENEISTLNKRLNESKHILEETNRDIQEIVFLSNQAEILKSQEKLLKEAAENEQKVDEKTRLEDLKSSLQFSANALSTKNITLYENFPHISIEGINKLNASLTKLQVGLKGLSSTFKTSLGDANDLKECVTHSHDILQEIKDVTKTTTTSQNELDKIIITHQSIKLDVINSEFEGTS